MSIFTDDLEAKGALSPSPEEEDEAPPAWLQKGPTKKRSIFAADLEAKGALDDEPAVEPRLLKNTGPDLQGQMEAEAKAVPFPHPYEDAKERVSTSFKNLGHTVASGAGAMLEGALHPVDTITSPQRRREFERGVGDVVTLGYANRLASKVDPENFGPEAEAADAEAAPGFRAAGGLTGMFMPSPAAALAGKAAKAIPGTGALAAGARGVAGYEAAAVPAAAAQTAFAGGDLGDVANAAADAATDPAGLAIGAGASAMNVVGPKIADRIEETRGAKARRIIEQKGGGTVSLASPGKGGVFDTALAGIGTGDQAVGTAAQRGGEILVEKIRQDHRIETSEPYRKLKAQIDATPMAREKVDVTPIVVNMMDAVDDLGTHPVVRSQLQEQLSILERRRANPEDPILISQEQLNALRKTLMKLSKTGMTDAPGANEAPLRSAAFAAKEMVDQGPYARLNELFAEGAQKTAERRKLLGLAKKSPADENVDFNKARLNIQRGEAETNSATGGAFTDRIRKLREQNPSYAEAIDLPSVARARNDLEFHLAPHHGGLMARAGGEAMAIPLTAYGMVTHPLATSAALAATNLRPLQGRVLAPIGDALRRSPTASPAAVARLIQAGRAGATRTALQAQAERDGVPQEIADNIAASQGL